MKYRPKIIHGDCTQILDDPTDYFDTPINLTFLDPPFNQNKTYDNHNDNMDEKEYWDWMELILKKIYNITEDGGALFFMQREKNTRHVLNALHRSNWTFQNLVIWKKKTSAVPQKYRFGKQYQVIAFAAKGDKIKNFNRLRIDLPLEPGQKVPRENGVFVTDIWDDIRELTSGFFAGKEALRDKKDKKRLHEQQAPISLLFRIILSTTRIGDIVLDPFAGTGTTNIVANQLHRHSVGIESSKKNIDIINQRIENKRDSDDVSKLMDYYRFTENLGEYLNYKSETKKKSLMSYLS